MKAQTGGPAFPIPGLHANPDYNGMTLRDYFAARAMQGMIANGENNPQAITQAAYIVADLMLKERMK